MTLCIISNFCRLFISCYMYLRRFISTFFSPMLAVTTYLLHLSLIRAFPLWLSLVSRFFRVNTFSFLSFFSLFTRRKLIKNASQSLQHLGSASHRRQCLPSVGQLGCGPGSWTAAARGPRGCRLHCGRSSRHSPSATWGTLRARRAANHVRLLR